MGSTIGLVSAEVGCFASEVSESVEGASRGGLVKRQFR
jgi:hypothetical protein